MDALDALRESKLDGIKTTLDLLSDLQASLPEYVSKPRTGMHYGEQIKYVTWRFPTNDFKTLEVLHLTDVQFGHICCNIPQLLKYRDWILQKPNRYVLFGGDMIDAATVLSPGEPWENLFSPQRQLYKFCEIIAPLRARILGYVGGNHERRGIRTFGDLGITIATLLRIPYSAGQQFVSIEFGEWKQANPFKFFLYHGRGAARTPGAKLMMLYYTARELSGGAHVTLVGHLHDSLMKMATNRVYEEKQQRIVDRKVAMAMSSSFLEYFGSYAEVAGMSPSDLIMARTTIEAAGRWELTIR